MADIKYVGCFESVIEQILEDQLYEKDFMIDVQGINLIKGYIENMQIWDDESSGSETRLKDLEVKERYTILSRLHLVTKVYTGLEGGVTFIRKREEAMRYKKCMTIKHILEELLKEI